MKAKITLQHCTGSVETHIADCPIQGKHYDEFKPPIQALFSGLELVGTIPYLGSVVIEADDHDCTEHLVYKSAEWTEPHGEHCTQDWSECSVCGEIVDADNVSIGEGTI